MKRKDHPTETGQVRKKRKITTLTKNDEQAKRAPFNINTDETNKTPKRKREQNKNIQSLESAAKKARKSNGEEKKTPNKKASVPAES